MSFSRHVYDGHLWDSVTKKVADLGCSEPIRGDSQEVWLLKVDEALGKALDLQAKLVAVMSAGTKPMAPDREMGRWVPDSKRRG